jgi:signal transduction histidine kinase
LLIGIATLLSIAVLGWLGVRTLQQDRELEAQRQRERVDVAAGRVALEIERRMLDIEDQLGNGTGIRFLPIGLESSADMRILFQPVATGAPPMSPTQLVDAEVAEYQRHDLVAAAAAYRRLTNAGPEPLRAAALVGLGRVRRLQKDYAGSLDAFAQLERLGPVIVAGQPAGLVALQGRCKTLEMAGDHDHLHVAVRALTRALESGRWSIDRSTFDLYQQLASEWGGTQVDSSAIARTEAAIELWHAWRRGDLPSRGRRVIVREPVSLMAVWVGEVDRVTLWIETGVRVEELWRPLWQGQGLRIALSDVDGRRFLGTLGDRTASLAPSETRLPFFLSASLIDGNEGTERTRRSVLVIGLALAFSLMIAAAYAVYRTTTRELALARQQADFVSAVSHEFRTPLTSMRHLTDLLVSGSVRSDERKGQYYELLARETERLHRMVESLLSFGRMDVNAFTWHLEPADVDRIVTAIVEEFRHDSIAAGRQVSCEIEDRLPPIRADCEAMSRALWNLLENAGKYSNPGTPIHVLAKRQGESVLLSVRDEGIGIPAVEQRRIFQKFVRGAEATRSGIRGVGLGLALVTRIAEAHGGAVRLDSEPGRGSTFTLVLPCLES